jgi:hypothetical protein
MTGRLPCVICGRPSVDYHHVTQRQIDPDVVLPLCHDHHELMGDDWHTAGIPPETEAPTVLHQLELGLRRWAMLIGRAAVHPLLAPAAPLLRVLAAWMAKWAARLRACIAGLDQACPEWRQAPGLS